MQKLVSGTNLLRQGVNIYITFAATRSHYFPSQHFDLLLQIAIFAHLALEKAYGDPCLFFDSAGGQQVSIGELVTGLANIVYLHQPCFNQSAQTIIRFANADAQASRHIALADLRLFRKKFQKSVTKVIA